MPSRFVCCGLFALLWALAVKGQGATIIVGDHVLAPNTAGQAIPITVTGGDEVAGVNLYVQIGDGGPELSDFGFPAGTDGPAITAVDLKTETIFAGVNAPQDNQEGIPQVAVSSIEFLTPEATTNADGLLASLTIDTTGFTDGRWDLSLGGVLPMFELGPFETDFAGIPATIVNGSVEIDASTLGDFDFNGVINELDVDLLHAALRQNSSESLYDVDASDSVDAADLAFHIQVILGTFFGDTDLNRVVDARDLNRVGISWRSSGASVRWSTGDFNGDQLVDARDLNLLGLNWRAAANLAAVPEPTGTELRLVGALVALALRRRCQYRRGLFVNVS